MQTAPGHLVNVASQPPGWFIVVNIQWSSLIRTFFPCQAENLHPHVTCTITEYIRGLKTQLQSLK